MQYRRLGRTGLEVSEVGYGAWGIGKQMWRGADDRESLRALQTAVEGGLNFIDTALAYGNGHSERLVGEFVRGRSEQLYVATKVPPKNLRWPAQGSLNEVFPSRYVEESTEQSLRNLGLERIDLQQLHVWSPDWLGQDEWHDCLDRLRSSGKIAHFGVSVNDHLPQTAVALVESGKVDSVQVIYNIFDQSPEDELLPACQKHDVGFIARVPFDEGALTGNITPQTTFAKKDWRNHYFAGDRKEQVHRRVQKLAELLDGEVESLPELALRFCLHHPGVSTVIPGMRTSAHVVDNLAVSDRPPLSAGLIRKLRQHRWEKNFYSAG